MAKKKLNEMTVTGFENLQREYRHLIDVEKPENQRAVAEARAQGDLSENADYDAATKKQGEIQQRIDEIEAIKGASVVLLTAEDLKNLTNEFNELSDTETVETSARLEELTFILENKKILASNSITIGYKVVYRDERNGKEKAVSIVGTVEADPLQGKVSNLSPVGTALYGRHVGDVVTVKAPNEDYQIEVLSFELDK